MTVTSCTLATGTRGLWLYASLATYYLLPVEHFVHSLDTTHSFDLAQYISIFVAAPLNNSKSYTYISKFINAWKLSNCHTQQWHTHTHDIRICHAYILMYTSGHIVLYALLSAAPMNELRPQPWGRQRDSVHHSLEGQVRRRKEWFQSSVDSRRG